MAGAATLITLDQLLVPSEAVEGEADHRSPNEGKITQESSYFYRLAE
jgi:hypothetical protein